MNTFIKGCLTLLGGTIVLISLLAAAKLVLDELSHTKPPIRNGCANNLRQIGLGLHMYSGDHQSKFPDTFIALKPYLKQWKLFACPKHDPEVTYPLAWNEIKRYGSYYYITGLTEQDAEDRVHMFELPSNHNGEGGNILYAAGYVQWHSTSGPSAESFWDILAKNGITKDMVLNATSRIIRVEDLTPVK